MYSGNHKISYGCKNLQGTLMSKFSGGAPHSPVQNGGRGGGGCAPLQHPTKPLLVQEDSTPATLKFPSVTFSI